MRPAWKGASLGMTVNNLHETANSLLAPPRCRDIAREALYHINKLRKIIRKQNESNNRAREHRQD
jgi:hypothetical protein